MIYKVEIGKFENTQVVRLIGIIFKELFPVEQERFPRVQSGKGIGLDQIELSLKLKAVEVRRNRFVFAGNTDYEILKTFFRAYSGNAAHVEIVPHCAVMYGKALGFSQFFRN